MTSPNLLAADVQSALVAHGVSNVRLSGSGGQKQVFQCDLGGTCYAIKFLRAPAPSPALGPPDQSVALLDEITERATREVETMRQCTSPHLVRLGPLGLRSERIAGQDVIYFSEEWIAGQDLKAVVVRDGSLPVDDVVRLGHQLAEAIEELWSHQKIHRDIKPANIMKRDNNDFVLLDLGLVFDLGDISLTAVGHVAGTPLYYSPEQLNPVAKRHLDFRSDLFALGITMYEVITGQHPFCPPRATSTAVWGHILYTHPPAPSSIRPDIPPALDRIILRLLGKRSHLRYRSCRVLRQALEAV